MSDIDVFKNDAAQLMFAHYANNLTGLALVYGAPSANSANKVDYPPSEEDIKISHGPVDRLSNWLTHQFEKNDMADFLKKSQHWAYEKEYRLFAKPGIQSEKEHKLELKAILYTPRFDHQMVNLLENIKSKHYDNKIIIRKILPHLTKPKFAFTRNAKDDEDIVGALKNQIENT